MFYDNDAIDAIAVVRAWEVLATVLIGLLPLNVSRARLKLCSHWHRDLHRLSGIGVWNGNTGWRLGQERSGVYPNAGQIAVSPRHRASVANLPGLDEALARFHDGSVW